MDKNQILLSFWEKLKSVSKLSFHAQTKSKEANGWSGKGQGDVSIVKESNHVCIFTEKGSWLDKQESEINFTNTYRWTLDRNACVISLEHLRRGQDNPVFLFHLSPTGKQSLSSVNSHLCKEDAYFGQIHFDRYVLCLCWRVIGPKKNEELYYFYS